MRPQWYGPEEEEEPDPEERAYEAGWDAGDSSGRKLGFNQGWAAALLAARAEYLRWLEDPQGGGSFADRLLTMAKEDQKT